MECLLVLVVSTAFFGDCGCYHGDRRDQRRTTLSGIITSCICLIVFIYAGCSVFLKVFLTICIIKFSNNFRLPACQSAVFRALVIIYCKNKKYKEWKSDRNPFKKIEPLRNSFNVSQQPRSLNVFFDKESEYA